MSTSLWILCIYLFTVVVSYPFLRSYFIKHDEEESMEFRPEIKALIVSIIPIGNIKETIKIIFQWVVMKFMIRKIKKMAKGKDTDTQKDLNKLVDSLNDFNKLL